jgi:hypothetical protein
MSQAYLEVSGWSFGMPRGSMSAIGGTMHNKAAPSMQNLTTLKRAESQECSCIVGPRKTPGVTKESTSPANWPGSTQ